jgi:hypothetical protein
MSYSSDVSAGDTILASHHNNLRKDVVDTTGGHIHDGVGSKLIPPNIVSVRLSDDQDIIGPWQARTGAVVTINVKGSGTVRVSVLFGCGMMNGTYTNDLLIELRINRDSGTQYVNLGQWLFKTNAQNMQYFNCNSSGEVLFTGLSAGDHTFQLEIQTYSATSCINRCNTQPTEGICEVVAHEL